MPHGVHNAVQTAFRLPEGLLVRLRAAAERHGMTMTEIVARGTKAELDRLDRNDTPPETTQEQTHG